MRAYYRREMTEQSMVQAVDPALMLAVLSEPPRYPCFLKGPRGGLHMVVGEWDISVGGPGADHGDPLSQRWVAVFRADTRYLRPRSRLWEQARVAVA